MKAQTILWVCMVLLLGLGSCSDSPKKLREEYVVDEAKILTQEQKGELNAISAELESRTGSQMVVNTLDSLNGKTIEAYANQTFNTWGLGRKDVNDGILIVVAVNDRKTRIEVGYGLETIVTDSIAAGIIDRNLVTNFKTGNYYEGLSQATQKIKELIEGHRDQIGKRTIPPPMGRREEVILPPAK